MFQRKSIFSKMQKAYLEYENKKKVFDFLLQHFAKTFKETKFPSHKMD